MNKETQYRIGKWWLDKMAWLHNLFKPKKLPCFKGMITLPEGTKREPLVERLKTVTVKPGDWLVIETDEHIPDSAYERVREMMQAKGFQCLLLEKSRLAAVLRKQELVGGIDFGQAADEVPGR